MKDIIKKSGKSKVLLSLLICAIIFCFYTNSANSQSLQFNRVLLVGAASPQTVPTDHVWKINGYMPSIDVVPTSNATGGSSGRVTNSFKILVNGASIYIGGNYCIWTYGSAMGYTDISGSTETLISPVWLPAGAYIQASTNVYAISITEFEILP